MFHQFLLSLRYDARHLSRPVAGAFGTEALAGGVGEQEGEEGRQQRRGGERGRSSPTSDTKVWQKGETSEKKAGL